MLTKAVTILSRTTCSYGNLVSITTKKLMFNNYYLVLEILTLIQLQCSFVNILVILNFTDNLFRIKSWSNVIWQKKGKFVCALKRFCLKEIHACCHTFIHNTKAILKQFYLRNEIAPMSSSPVTVFSRDINTSINQSWIVIKNA